MEQKVYVTALLLLICGTSSLSETCPKVCNCVDYMLYCDSKELPDIPDSLPQYVVHLNLQNNQIKEIDGQKLSRLVNLEALLLQMNQLTELRSNNFFNMSKLKKLYIGNNNIENVSADAFNNLPSLQFLDLTDNKISDISEKLNISSLITLMLGLNQLTILTDSTFNGVKGIVYLVLSENNISWISKSAFDDMNNLSILDLRGNPLKSIDNIFQGIGTLHRLDVSACQMTNIPEGLPWALRSLILSNNHLTIIHNRDLASVRYLGLLSLENNQIRNIEPGALSHSNYLSDIRLSNNSLKQLPDVIPASVQKFVADDNKIHHVFQTNFAHDSKIKQLSLKNNLIRDLVANTFSRIGQLTSLSLSQNNITIIRNMTFAGLRNLQFLYLEFNPISTIELRALGSLMRLSHLKLAGIQNVNTKIEGVIFQDVPSLVSLDLQSSPSIVNGILNDSKLLHSLHMILMLNMKNSSLQTLDTEIRMSLPALKILEISQNPWYCDEKLVALRNWIKELPQLFPDSSGIRCTSPERVKGRSLEDLDIEELTIPTTTTMMPQSTLQTNTSEVSTGLNETKLLITNEFDIQTDSMIPTRELSRTTVGEIASSQNTTNNQANQTSFPEYITRPQTSVTHLLNTSAYTDLTSMVQTEFMWTSSQAPYNKPSTPISTEMTSTLVQPSKASQAKDFTDTSKLTTIMTPSTISSTDSYVTSTSQAVETPSEATFDTTDTFPTNTSRTSVSAMETSEAAIATNPATSALTMQSGNPKLVHSSASGTDTTLQADGTGSTSAFENTLLDNVTASSTTQDSFNRTDEISHESNGNYPIIPPNIGENRLPTFSTSANVKLRTIIIGVSVSLLALVIGVFIVIGAWKCHKRHRQISFDGQNQESRQQPQTETSDTVFIISHMEENVHASVQSEHEQQASCTEPASSKKSASNKKGSKVNRQCSTTSSSSSPKTNFDCITGHKEDDSELLMYTWK